MSNALWYNNWDYWNLFHKVTFDGPNKLILIGYGVTNIDVQTDIYSDWKEWTGVRDNLKYAEALRKVGGDNTIGNAFLGVTFFLTNGWRIRTWEGNHRLNLDGNLFVEGSGSIFVDTLRPWMIQTSIMRSNLVDVVVVSGSSAVVSGTFSAADRIILERIDSVIQNLPNSGSFVDVQNSLDDISNSVIAVTNEVLSGFSAQNIKHGGVVVGQTTDIQTDIFETNGFYDNLYVTVENASRVKIIRRVDSYLSASGTFVFDNPLPFLPVSGSPVTVLNGYDTYAGGIG